MSAMANWIAWCCSDGWPNASRCLAYADALVHAALSQAGGQRGDRHPALVQDPQELGVAPAAPAEQVSAGTRQPVKESSRVSEAHHPTLEYSGPGTNPAVPFGIMIEEISLPPRSSRPVMARTVTSDVIEVPELVMNALLPSTTHSPASSRAVVRMPPGMSDPPPASVGRRGPSAPPRTVRAASAGAVRPCRTGRWAWRPGRPRPPG